jgi:Pex14 N-terminal domain
MSDSNQREKKPGVPSWQLKTKDGAAKEEEKSAPEPRSRETVIEQAKKFLEEDEVRNASTDKKIAFLESKGLRSEEIHDLLGVTRNPEASSEVSARIALQTSLC